MGEWLDCPVPGFGLHTRSEHDYWCFKCKEAYNVSLRLDRETGEWDGDESCPLCGHDGVLASEIEDNIVE